MPYRETLPRRGIARRQMLKRVARFSKLKGFDGGLPDSRMPGCERILYNVIGFQPPKTERDGKQSPVGAEFTRESMDELERKGVWPRRRRKAGR